MATIEYEPQNLTALRLANATKRAATEIKLELKAGDIRLAEAICDPRAASLTIFALLKAQPRWGKDRAGRLLRRLEIAELKRVRDLTERQRGVIVQAAS